MTAGLMSSFDDTVLTRFERHALATPDAVAIAAQGRTLTYGELNRLADRIASALNALPCSPDSPIGLMMNEGPYLVASILGAMKANRIFTPFEMAAPPSWLSQVISDSGISHVLTDEQWHGTAQEAAGKNVPVFEIEEFGRTGSGLMARPAGNHDGIVAVIYTSGSTGKPKGVALTHASALHSANARAELLQVRPQDRIGNLRPTATVAGINNISLALIAGASLYPLDMRNHSLPQLSAWLQANKMTGITFSGSLLRTWLSSLREDQEFPSLRFVIATAEPFYGSDLVRLARHLTGDWRVMHSLASSEAGVVAADILTPSSRIAPGPLPVGYPLDGMEIEIRREDGTLADTGEVGEIIIRSRFLSAGYWRDQAATDASFGVEPADTTLRTYRSGDLAMRRPDGRLEHHGRKGRRAKVRGYTVEPFQIERALLCLPGVQDALVLVSDHGAGEARLIAYVVAPGLSGVDIRKGVEKALPPQLVPSDIVLMEKFPLTSRGKLDRNALPLPGARRRQSKAFRPATDDYERAVAAIWQQVLNVERIGIDDDFYELGGTSLQAFAIFARIAAQMGSDLPPTTIVKASTIAKLAEIVRRGGRRIGQDAKLVPFGEGTGKAPLFIVHAAFGDIMFVRDLAGGMNGARAIYGVQPAPLNGKSALPRTVEGLAADYLAEIRKLQPKGPYYFAGYSFGGWVALEMAQQARRRGDEVALLGIIDTHANVAERFGPRMFRHVEQMGRPSVFSYIGTRLRKSFTALIRQAQERLQYLPSDLRLALGLPLPYESRTKYYNHVFRRAGARYLMKAYDGDIVVFSSAGRAGTHRAFWQRFAKGAFVMHEFSTDHYGIVLPPHSVDVGRHLDMHLDAVSAE